MRQACRMAEKGDHPMSHAAVAEADLQFVATQACQRLCKNMSPRVFKAKIFALRDKLSRASNHVRNHMHEDVRRVAGDFNIPMIAALIVAMKWPDKELPGFLFKGFPIVGRISNSFLFRPSEPEKHNSINKVVAAHEGNLNKWFDHKPPKEAVFLAAACEKDESNGFASRLYTKAEIDAIFGPGKWCSNPRFCIEQASGKKRPIDDGARSGLNLCMSFFERLCLCSSLHPCLFARLFGREGPATKDSIV